jgi:hypothetical protein
VSDTFNPRTHVDHSSGSSKADPGECLDSKARNTTYCASDNVAGDPRAPEN